MLRGINLGPHNRLSMPEFASALESVGLREVKTYLQSGNVVFASSESPDKLPHLISQTIKKKFGHDIDVWVKSAAELKRIAGSNPFLAGPGADVTKLHVTFMAGVPNPELLLTVNPDLGGDDKWAPIASEVYLYCPGGYGRTKLNNNLFEKRFKLAATTRNWKTVLALAELLGKN